MSMFEWLTVARLLQLVLLAIGVAAHNSQAFTPGSADVASVHPKVVVQAMDGTALAVDKLEEMQIGSGSKDRSHGENFPDQDLTSLEDSDMELTSLEQLLNGEFSPDRTNGEHTEPSQTAIIDAEIDYPLNGAVNSFFPIDSLITYNTTSHGNSTLHEIVGRYASFSPILSHPLESNFRILPHDACHLIPRDEFLEYTNTILVLLRGDCTFVSKVTNILSSGLDAKAVVIANDEPYKGLITMYSSSFNSDGSLKFPVMLITYEDYMELKELAESKDLVLQIETASFGSWFNLVLSMVLSPPLLILSFYIVIVCGQKYKKRQENFRNSRLVKKLTVFIYNGDHLIDINAFKSYLKVTGQTPSPTNVEDSPKASGASSMSALNRIVINGVDIRKLSKQSPNEILTTPHDFYPSYKCSICLDKYTPLRSRVLILDCKHFYHEKCLSNWLINFRRSCPLCNTAVLRVHGQNGYLLLGGSNSYGSTDLENQGDQDASDRSTESHGDGNQYGRDALESSDSLDLVSEQSLEESNSDATVELYENDAIPESSSYPDLFEMSGRNGENEGEEEHNEMEPQVDIDENHSDGECDVNEHQGHMNSSSPGINRSIGKRLRRGLFARPMHILSQYSSESTLDQNVELSMSIDSKLTKGESAKSPPANSVSSHLSTNLAALSRSNPNANSEASTSVAIEGSSKGRNNSFMHPRE